MTADVDLVTTARHGECVTCGLVLDTPERAAAHSRETLAADGVRGHQWRRINPTAEQIAERVVDDAISDALDAWCQRMDEEVYRGRLTNEQVTKAAQWRGDFQDAWVEFLEESDQ